VSRSQAKAGAVPATAAAKHRIWRPIVLIVAVVATVVLAGALGLGEKLSAIREWIGSLGFFGPVVFIAIYAAATVAAIPGSALTVAAGALFGSVVGVIAVSAGSTLGAALSFLIARYFARDAISSWLSDKDKFRRLDRMTEKQGAIIVAITRLVPLFPFNLLNYGFGLTHVSFRTYVFWSWLCMLPGTILYVVGADAIVRAVREGRVPWPLVAVLVGATVLLVIAGTRARRRLREPESGER
jgi:uncharacterized membrane protein YdjX (TVP38/TMEM64 family)